MAIHGISLAETENFIIPEDPGHPDNIKLLKAGVTPEEPTVFLIGVLTVDDRTELGDMGATPTMRDSGISMQGRETKKAYEIVRRGLKGWTNFVVGGAPMPFEAVTDNIGASFRIVASSNCMLVMDKDTIQSIANQILERNGMKSTMEKKLEGASLLPNDLGSQLGGVTTPAPETTKKNEGVNEKPSEA